MNLSSTVRNPISFFNKKRRQQDEDFSPSFSPGATNKSTLLSKVADAANGRVDDDDDETACSSGAFDAEYDFAANDNDHVEYCHKLDPNQHSSTLSTATSTESLFIEEQNNYDAVDDDVLVPIKQVAASDKSHNLMTMPEMKRELLLDNMESFLHMLDTYSGDSDDESSLEEKEDDDYQLSF